QIAKSNGAEFLAWALSCCVDPPRLSFVGWDDSRRLVVPGEPDRVNDLVARVRDEVRPRREAWLLVEIEEEANPGIFLRTGQYELLLMKEVNPLCEHTGALVVSLVLNLSGKQKRPGVDWSFGSYGTHLQPMIVDVARQDAAT